MIFYLPLLILGTISMIPVSFGGWGFKTAGSVSSTAMNCLQNAGADFVVVRVWTNEGKEDRTGINNLKTALNVGLSAFAYFVPCVRCSATPSQQMDELSVIGKQEGIQFKGVFMQLMRGVGSGWSKYQSQSIDYMKKLTDGCTGIGSIPVFWSSNGDWKSLTGNDVEFADFIQYVVYTHFDNQMSENDWHYGGQGFGAFPKPYMKEFQRVTLCGVNGTKMYAPYASLTAARDGKDKVLAVTKTKL